MLRISGFLRFIILQHSRWLLANFFRWDKPNGSRFFPFPVFYSLLILSSCRCIIVIKYSVITVKLTIRRLADLSSNSHILLITHYSLLIEYGATHGRGFLERLPTRRPWNLPL